MKNRNKNEFVVYDLNFVKICLFLAIFIQYLATILSQGKKSVINLIFMKVRLITDLIPRLRSVLMRNHTQIKS